MNPTNSNMVQQTYVGFRTEADFAQKIVEHAAKENRTVSNWLKTIIKNQLEEEKQNGENHDKTK